MASEELSWALVTGASSGIGKEFALLLAERGYPVILTARREDRLQTLADEIRQRFRVDTRVFVRDLSAPGGASALCADIRREKLLVEILVNNAGFGQWGKFIETSGDREAEMIELNVMALVALTKHFLPGMVAKGRGRVLNVASTAAFQPGPFMSVYFATKAFVLSFSEGVNEELRGTGVNVTTLCPGPTESEFFDTAEVGSKGLTVRKLPSSREVAQLGLEAMFAGKRTVVHGGMNRFLAFLQRVVPRGRVIAITRKMLEH